MGWLWVHPSRPAIQFDAGPPQQCWRIVSYSGAPAAIIWPLNRSGASTVGEWFRMELFMVVVNVQCPKAVWSSVTATSYLPSQAIRSKSKGQPEAISLYRGSAILRLLKVIPFPDKICVKSS